MPTQPTCHPDRWHKAKGLCNSCYHNNLRKARTATRYRAQNEDPAEFALTKTKPGPNGCLDWTGVTHKEGYARIWFNRKWQMVTRLILAKKIGRPIVDGAFAMHTCDRPICINPEHIIEGTHADNMADMRQKGRNRFGERSPFAKLTSEQVTQMRTRHANGETFTALGREFGVTGAHVGNIVAKKKWAHLSSQAEAASPAG